jgi:two-component system chemotaxis sensor kinase CheA
MSDEHAALLEVFRAQAEEVLDDLEDGLVHLEADPENVETLREVFRLVHTLKGDALSLGFSGLGALSHAVEDLLDALREGLLDVTPERVTLLLRATDSLRELASDAVGGGPEAPSAPADLLEALAAEGQARPGESAPTAGPGGPRPPTHRLGPGRTGRQARTLRVDVERLDHLLTLTGEIAVSRGRLTQLLEDEHAGHQDLLEYQRESERLHLDLQELVMRLRMVPVGPTFQQFRRTVRDLSHSLGKEAQLHVAGGEVEVDNSVLQLLRDPLAHMIRNALDHGIEAPESREERDKSRSGRIALRAFHDAGNIVIEVEDDGAGLDHEGVLAKARRVGLMAPDREPSVAEVHRLILEPGLSTSQVVSDVSGRGVGMDVVRRNIEALRGSISIASEPGRGTRFTVRLPLTLAIIEGLIVGVGDDTFVIPVDAVVETIELPREARGRVDGRGVLGLRGGSLPYVRLRQRFGVAGPAPSRENVVVLQQEDGRAGLVVDRIQGQRQTVIKPLAKVFQGVSGISASAILGNGRVALILDVPGLLRTEMDPAHSSRVDERMSTC